MPQFTQYKAPTAEESAAAWRAHPEWLAGYNREKNLGPRAFLTGVYHQWAPYGAPPQDMSVSPIHPTAGGAQPPLPWQQLRQPGMGFGVIDNPNWFQQQSQLPQGLPQQPIMPQQPQQPTTGFEDRPRPWQMTPRMSFNLRPPTSMQPNWRQAWNWQQPQQQQQQMPSQQAPLKTNSLTSYDWTS